MLLLHGDRIGDVNDNLRWACSGIPGVERHTPKVIESITEKKSHEFGKISLNQHPLLYNRPFQFIIL